jgi:hypothetical protein
VVVLETGASTGDRHALLVDHDSVCVIVRKVAVTQVLDLDLERRDNREGPIGPRNAFRCSVVERELFQNDAAFNRVVVSFHRLSPTEGHVRRPTAGRFRYAPKDGSSYNTTLEGGDIKDTALNGITINPEG